VREILAGSCLVTASLRPGQCYCRDLRVRRESDLLRNNWLFLCRTAYLLPWLSKWTWMWWRLGNKHIQASVLPVLSDRTVSLVVWDIGKILRPGWHELLSCHLLRLLSAAPYLGTRSLHWRLHYQSRWRSHFLDWLSPNVESKIGWAQSPRVIGLHPSCSATPA